MDGLNFLDGVIVGIVVYQLFLLAVDILTEIYKAYLKYTDRKRIKKLLEKQRKVRRTNQECVQCHFLFDEHLWQTNKGKLCNECLKKMIDNDENIYIF